MSQPSEADLGSPAAKDYISIEYAQQPIPYLSPHATLRKAPVFDEHLKQLVAQRQSETVYLNVYHVTSLNQLVELSGFGLYHTSVGIFGLEISYGGTDDDTPGTVVVQKGNTAGLTLKESIPIGKTYFNLQEINSITEDFGTFWSGKDYDPFRHNCNDFTRKFAEMICDGGQAYFPSYINRFTKLGTLFRMWFHPLEKLLGNLVDYDHEGGTNEECLFAVGVPRSPSKQQLYNYTPQLPMVEPPLGSPKNLISVEHSLARDSQCDETPAQIQQALQYKCKGDHFYDYEQYEQAFEHLQISLRMLQDCPNRDDYIEPQLEILLSMCESAHQLGWLRQVVQYGDECLQLAQISRVYHLVGKALVGMGHISQSYPYLESALRLEPGSSDVKTDLQYVVECLDQD